MPPEITKEWTRPDGTVWVDEYCDGCSTTSSHPKGTAFPHSHESFYGWGCPRANYDEIDELRQEVADLTTETHAAAVVMKELCDQLEVHRKAAADAEEQLQATTRVLGALAHAATCGQCGTAGGRSFQADKPMCEMPFHQALRRARIILDQKTVIHAPECECAGEVFCPPHYQELLDMINRPPRIIPKLQEILARYPRKT